MEIAIFFRVALAFGRHTIAILQMVRKEDPVSCGPYEGNNLEEVSVF